MSFTVSKAQQFSEAPLEYILAEGNSSTGLPLLGGIFCDAQHVWHAKGPCLEVRNTHSRAKVGAWTFGSVLKDSNTKIVCVEEIERTCGRISLLAVGLECTITGGLICIFDVLSSTVIRTIHVKEKISHLKVVDPGLEVLNLPGPLHDFDGIICVGLEGGDVLLVDLCRQICEQPLRNMTIRDELSPCQLTVLTSKNVTKIEHFKELSIREGNHLAIHLNKVPDSKTEHFCLKGQGGEDRLFVNKEEVIVSALYYCPQLTSLLVGFNFGAFQLWNLTNLSLVYTSPVCDDHLPITNFALQEPTDDPRAFCYIWVSYSNTELYQTGLPFAVMYSFAYEIKEYHDGYGYLYQDFQHCSIRYQIELGSIDGYLYNTLPKGGKSLNLQPILKQPINKDLYAGPSTGDTLALCMISWSVWFDKGEQQTNALIFDLNQWYKEQMPNFSKWKDCTNYILKVNVSELIVYSARKSTPILYLLLDEDSLNQFTSVQRLEEHFYPTSLSFNLYALREKDVITISNEGLQKNLLHQLEVAGPLCLIKPTDIYKQSIHLGLIPLFVDVLFGNAASLEFQRETILNVALEYQLFGWICKCASEWANGSFSSSGCTLDFLLNWAFQRAIVLKTNCDRYCMPLFDYSQSRLDQNTSVRLNSCSRQISDLCSFYKYILKNVSSMSVDLITEQHDSLEMISTYFEVLQWLVNIGLLPEGHHKDYPRTDHFERISAPYPVQELIEYYNEKRAHLHLISEETFASSDSLLFIDNLIISKCGAERLQKQWQEDGGSGLYPPPSLQSMLRSYLVQGTSISCKHSLVIYVFLDLAMTLDQTKYSAVITNLIKFPAVFKVSPSIIKITQAFWQLDHGDYSTAIEQLLDPFVLEDDLQSWHHAVAMRALLLQEQYNLALLYMQIRKPPITDEKDILTTISLFIANNMLDEALSFKRHCYNYDEEKLLKHFFNECNKNKSIHALLYKCLNNNEERAFFNYLKTINKPTASDLQVFYNLLRSRFVEAFDIHSHIRRRKVENQGLMEQISGTTTDQVVKIFKTLLPDANKNLVDYVRKERTNIWKEVPKPAPLSVSIHETNEKVRYKSSMIFAALAKAKETFNDHMNETTNDEFLTEGTPFLRTPNIFKSKSRSSTPIIKPKFILAEENDDEMEATPAKRLKLSPRPTKPCPTPRTLESIHSKMLTPLVKRRISPQTNLLQQINESSGVCTPQSILKVRSLVHRLETRNGDSIMDNSVQDTSIKSSFCLQPRMSLSKVTKRQHVKFDDKTKLQSSSESSLNFTSIEDMILNQASLSAQDASLITSSNVSTASTAEDKFYSPDNSDHTISMNEYLPLEEKMDSSHDKIKHPEVLFENSSDRKESHCDDTEKVQLLELESIEAESLNMKNISSSPKPRRSYKRSIGNIGSVEASRSSPRLRKDSSKKSENSLDTSQNTYATQDNSEQNRCSSSLSEPYVDKVSEYLEPDDSMSSDLNTKPSRLLEKVKSRKSLTRRVLEHNAFLRCHSTNITVSKSETTIKEEKSLDCSKTVTVESLSSLSEIISGTSSSKHISGVVSKKFMSEITINSDNDSYHKDSDSDDNLIDARIPSVTENELTISESNDGTEHNTGSPEATVKGDNCDKNTIIEDSKCATSRVFNDAEKQYSLSCSFKEQHTEPSFNESSNDMNTAIIDPVDIQDGPADLQSDPLDLQSDPVDLQESVLLQNEVNSPEYHISPNVSENQQKRVDKESQIICPMNVYEDLSSGSEDIEETLERSRKHFEDTDIMDVDQSNILDFTNQHNEHSLSEGFNLPDSEVAFLEVQSDRSSLGSEDNESNEGRITPDNNSVISISSGDSVNEEKPVSDDDSAGGDDFNIAIEHNLENINSSDESISSSDDHLSKNNTPPDNTSDQHGDETGMFDNGVIVDPEHSVQKLDDTDQNSENDITDKNETLNNPKSDHKNDFQETIHNERITLHFGINQKANTKNLADEDTTVHSDDNRSVDLKVAKELQTETMVADIHQPEREYLENVNRLDIETNKDLTITHSEITEKVDTFNVNPLSADTQMTPSLVNIHVEQTDSPAISSIHDECDMNVNLNKEQNVSIISKTIEDVKKDVIVDKSNRNMKTADDDSSPSDDVVIPAVSSISLKEESTEVKNTFMKVDRGTNTTMCSASKKKVPDQEHQGHEHSIQTVSDERQGTSKQNKMKIGEDSSSDTTEGDNYAQEIIVQAQVHTPRKKRTEEPLVKRVTRRNSVLMSQNLEPEAEESPKLETSLNLTDVFMKDPSPSPTVTPRIITRRSSHLGIVDNSIDLDDSKQSPCIIDMPNKIVNLMRRKRSASVDVNIKTYSRKSSMSVSSTGEKLEETVDLPRRKTRARSVIQMPVISEENNPARSTKSHGQPASALDLYTSSRRLTRKQASILKSITNPSTVTAQDDSEVEESVDDDNFDPMVLLDKSPFQGKPDPDEDKVYNSSPSDISVVGKTKPAKRIGRSASATLEESTPRRITRQRVASVDSPLASVTRTRSRKQSESSVASEISGPISPPKRAKKKTEDAENTTSVPRNTRSRTSSVSSVTSDVSSSSIASHTRGSKFPVARTKTLPEIIEEQSENDARSRKSPRRRISKQKH